MKPPGRLQQFDDVGLGVEVGNSPMVDIGQQTRGWHLGRRIEGLQVGGEAADHRQAGAPSAWAYVLRLLCPCDGVLGGDGVGADLLEVADEVSEQTTVGLELVAERPADREVLLDGK